MRKNILRVKNLYAREIKFATALAVLVMAGVFSQGDALAQQPSGAPTVGQTSTAPSAAPITTQTNTTGNTPSSVRTGVQNSGYSAGGNTSNTNINSTATGARNGGQPIGGGSNSTSTYGGRK